MFSKNLHEGSSQSGYVRVSHSLNAGEAKYVKERKERIAKWSKDHGVLGNKVPTFAVMGSGGGERAMVGLLGSLTQMAEDNLLDCALYLGGVSGSTWCMAALYEDPNWPSNLPSVKNKLVNRLLTGQNTKEATLNWLSEAVLQPNYSLTDFWAATAVYDIVKEMDKTRLSEQKDRGPTNPYPLYVAVDKELLETTACFFEVAPFEAGYSNLGAFVNTSCFGSMFKGGALEKQIEETDILYLQGMCGSGLADGKENLDFTKETIWDWIHSLFSQSGSSEAVEDPGAVKAAHCTPPACELLHRLVQLQLCYRDDERSSAVLNKLQTLQTVGTEKAFRVAIVSKENWLKMNPKQREGYVRELSTDICNSLEKKGQTSNFSETMEVMWNTIKDTLTWTWGTKYNFLYDYPTKERAIPDTLLTSTTRHLIDSGVQLNSPYAAVLRPARKVNLILSFDFSTGNPFQTVERAAEYCKQAGIPFPPVVIPENARANPSDFYVFKSETDKEAPTVIHIPIFNTVNCGDKIDEWRKKYFILQPPFNQEMIEDLLRVSALNVKNNKQRILGLILDACVD